MSIIRILLLGDEGTGKTTLAQQKINKVMRRSMDSHLNVFKPTVEYDVLKIQYEIDSRMIVGEIVDCSGKVKPKAENEIIKMTKACGIVFDLTNPKTFDSINTWKDHYFTIQSDPNIVLIGNKCDLIDKIQIKESQIRKWCEDNAIRGQPIPYYQTSAKNYEVIDEAFERIFSYGLMDIQDDQSIMNHTITESNQIIPLDVNSGQPDEVDGSKPREKGCICVIF